MTSCRRVVQVRRTLCLYRHHTHAAEVSLLVWEPFGTECRIFRDQDIAELSARGLLTSRTLLL